MMSFMKKHGWLPLTALTIFIIVIMWSFAGDVGFLPTGTDLDKSHWLGFWGSLLSFLGSIFLGLVAIYQNQEANKTNERILMEQKRQFEENNRPNICVYLATTSTSKKINGVRFGDGASVVSIAFRNIGNRTAIIKCEELENKLESTLNKHKITEDNFKNLEMFSLLVPCQDVKYIPLYRSHILHDEKIKNADLGFIKIKISYTDNLVGFDKVYTGTFLLDMNVFRIIDAVDARPIVDVEIINQENNPHNHNNYTGGI